MLESIKFLLEKIKHCRENCKVNCWWLCRILTAPISLIGLLFVQMGILIKWFEVKLGEMMEDEYDDKYRLGFCPKCSEGVWIREKRPDGDDICANGHKYPSKDTLKDQPKK